MKKALSLLLLCLMFAPASLGVKAQKTANKAAFKQSLPHAHTKFDGIYAYSDGQGALIKWQMVVETNNLGFFVYRVREVGEELVSAHKVIEGSAMRVGNQPLFGGEYSYFDPKGGPGVEYVVYAQGTDGTRKRSNRVVAESVSDLSGLGDSSADEMRAGVEAANWELERSELVVNKKLRREIDATTPVPNPEVHAQIVNQPGVKIAVKRSGLYRVLRADLAAAGFNVDSDATNWQLYADGVEQAIIVPAGGGYIEFIGRGVSTNESDTRTYFLTVGPAPGKRMITMASTPVNDTFAQHYEQILVKEERTTFDDNVINGPAENYWGRAVANFGPAEILFQATGISPDAPDAVVNVKVQGLSSGAHAVEVKLNNQVIGTLTGSNKASYSNDFHIPTSLLVEGTNSLKLLATASASDFSLFDTLRVSYFRKYVATGGRLQFFTPLNSGAKVEGFTTSDVRVFETTYDGSPMIVSGVDVEPSNGAFRVVIPADRARLFYAVEGSGVLSPVSITANNPASLKDPTIAADLVIITHKDLIAEAESWAAYRRSQGVAVKVVEGAEIYDEFNFGVLSAGSIESFLQYAVANWQVAPRYVLLIGDASYDPRNYEGRVFQNYVPTAMVNTLFSETASDEALADFNNDGMAELAIGRIPAKNPLAVQVMFNKTVAWEAALNDPLSRGALFASDLTDGWNFQAMSQRISNQLPATMPKAMVHRGDANATATLINEINTGKYLVNFAGHGSGGSWANSFFNVTHVPQLTNAGNQSLFTMLTCLNGYFHGIWNESFAEVLTRATNGGAVAAWASTGLTTPDAQELLATRFYSQIGNGSIPLLGDLVKDAKSAVNGGQDVRLSWVLIGDPMLKVR